MNCIIVDDEPLAREEMCALVGDVSDLSVIGIFSNAKTAMDFLSCNQVDVVFLDIEMPMVSGIEFASHMGGNTLVIFTTAYPQYALKSYELEAVDYLLKPVEKERLSRAILKAKSYSELLSSVTEKGHLEGAADDFLLIKSDRRFFRVPFREILFIEGLKDYVVLQLVGGKRLITAMNLKNIHQRMPQGTYLRVSKSYVVNLDFIDSFDHHTLFVQGFEIPLGEVFKKDFFRVYSKGMINPES